MYFTHFLDRNIGNESLLPITCNTFIKTFNLLFVAK